MSEAMVGCLYIAGFAQATAPHAGLIIPEENGDSGAFAHIKVEDGQWKREFRKQKIRCYFEMISLLQIQGSGIITKEKLQVDCRRLP